MPLLADNESRTVCVILVPIDLVDIDFTDVLDCLFSGISHTTGNHTRPLVLVVADQFPVNFSGPELAAVLVEIDEVRRRW